MVAWWSFDVVTKCGPTRNNRLGGLHLFKGYWNSRWLKQWRHAGRKQYSRCWHGADDNPVRPLGLHGFVRSPTTSGPCVRARVHMHTRKFVAEACVVYCFLVIPPRPHWKRVAIACCRVRDAIQRGWGVKERTLLIIVDSSVYSDNSLMRQCSRYKKVLWQLAFALFCH